MGNGITNCYPDEVDNFISITVLTGGRSGNERAEQLYDRVLSGYGDDSVAQLASAHIACEGVSNVLTKILERGRLMSYLEQSTRYVPYTERPDGQWKYHVPEELGKTDLRAKYKLAMDSLFETYAQVLKGASRLFETQYPRGKDEHEKAWRRAVRAKALDTARGLLPAATQSNLGLHGSAQSFEALILRLLSHRLAEARTVGAAIQTEVETIMPAFFRRIRRADRGVRTMHYRRRNAAAAAWVAAAVPQNEAEEQARGGTDAEEADVALVDYTAEGEARVLAAVTAQVTGQDLQELTRQFQEMPQERRALPLAQWAGERENRRERPGRALEAAEYCFQVTSDYGAFRDLQRHRMLSSEWELLSPNRGTTAPTGVLMEIGLGGAWDSAIHEATQTARLISKECGPTVAQYAVPMACRIRYWLRMNAREAMHVLELRTQPAGHAAYRTICQKMHRLIASEAQHPGIAKLMQFVDHRPSELGRRAAETRTAEGTTK